MSEAQPRTPKEYQAGGSSKWEDWARLEGKKVVDAAMVEYINQHPEIAEKGQDVLDQKWEEIAMEEAEKAGLDVSSPDAEEPQAA